MHGLRMQFNVQVIEGRYQTHLNLNVKGNIDIVSGERLA